LVSRPTSPPIPGVESVRLQKFLADAGVCSRRAGEALIEAGEVKVNGTPARLGQKVVPGADRVLVRGRAIGTTATSAAVKFTLALHKPRGVVCGPPDGRHPETIFDLIPRQFARQRFLLVGRLDREAEGLALVTADGALADRLARPGSGMTRKFLITLTSPFPAIRLALLTKGVRVEDETVRVTHAFLLHPGRDGSSPDVEVHVSHGRGWGLRELFGALGFEVKRLQCFQIGGLRLHGMPLRGAKVLGKHELELLTGSE